MKRLIYEPAEGEEIPETRATVSYTLPVAGVFVCDCIVDDVFTTEGIIHYDSTLITPAVFSKDNEPVEITPRVIAKELDEPFVHHFSGWENI